MRRQHINMTASDGMIHSNCFYRTLLTIHRDAVGRIKRFIIPLSMSFFSLIELMVIISIIAILTSILLPALKKAREVTKATQCKSNQRQCGIALLGYANDFDGWVMGGECDVSCTPYSNLGAMMIKLGYASESGEKPFLWSWIYENDFNRVYQCPSLPPPSSYQVNLWITPTQYPHDGLTSNNLQSYGLRFFYTNSHYPGEKQSGVDTSDRKLFIKIQSLHAPTNLPYMVDTAFPVKDIAGTGIAGARQHNTWYMSGGGWGVWEYNGCLQLRHNRHANVWMPDGHVESWDSSDAKQFTVPGPGTDGTTSIGYIY